MGCKGLGWAAKGWGGLQRAGVGYEGLGGLQGRNIYFE
jgi:hypothetical protein